MIVAVTFKDVQFYFQITKELTVATEYEGIDLAAIQQEYERVNAEQTNTGSGEDYLEKFVRLPERDGYTLMRILPRKKGEKSHYCLTRVHTLNNPTTNKKRTYHCPKDLLQTDKGPRWQGECIICKYYSDLWQKSENERGDTQEKMQQQARDIKPVERYYYNVVVRSEKDFKTGEIKKNVGPKIYSCGKTIHAKICRAIYGDKTAGEKGLGDITNPTNGRDFRVVKKVVKGGGGREYPNYDNSKFDDVSPAGSPEELANWIDNLHDLQSLRVVKTADELKHALRVHLGMVKEGDAQNDDLHEFRNAGAASSTVQSTVREDMIYSNNSSLSSASEDKEEILADDDFMKDLEDM
jgi:hypothetical protein